MKKYKLLFNVLIYLSLAFLLYYLYRFDYLDFRHTEFNYYYLIPSILLLWLGFLISPLSWKSVLSRQGIHISYRKALVSEGISIFTKYIPGKVLIILGRAGFVSLDGHALKHTSLASLKTQFISFWVGLVLGCIPLFFIQDSIYLILLATISCLLIIIFLHNKFVHNLFSRILGKILKKEVEVPLLKFSESLVAVVMYACMWIFWGSAFYLLASSISVELSPVMILLFPLSATVGMMAIIIPGGLGVREGIITFVLHKTGIPLEVATGLSVLSRLWYLSGEAFVFITALIMKPLLKKD
jgi:uncharacterized membrane protein YbhN (UPF0104 family)